jgi:hypothetical protein
MNHSRWLGPLVFSASGLFVAHAAAQSSGSQPTAQAPSDSSAAESRNAPAAAADAKADDFDRTPQDCITPSNIRETAVVDDSTILFYMRGGAKLTYRTSLPHTCMNLARENRFSYKVTMNRLCDTDLISVLEQWGVGLREGFTCRLGKFYPIPYEEAELLRKQHDKPTSTRGMKAKPAEVAPKSDSPAAGNETAPSKDQAPASEQAPAGESAAPGDSAPR